MNTMNTTQHIVQNYQMTKKHCSIQLSNNIQLPVFLQPLQPLTLQLLHSVLQNLALQTKALNVSLINKRAVQNMASYTYIATYTKALNVSLNLHLGVDYCLTPWPSAWLSLWPSSQIEDQDLVWEADPSSSSGEVAVAIN